MNFLKKNLSNIIFLGFIVFLFTPYGLPVRATMIKAVSFVTTRVFSLEIAKEDQAYLSDYHWQLQSLQGERVNMQAFKGKVMVINYWATWCPPMCSGNAKFSKSL